MGSNPQLTEYMCDTLPTVPCHKLARNLMPPISSIIYREKSKQINQGHYGIVFFYSHISHLNPLNIFKSPFLGTAENSIPNKGHNI